MPESTSPDLTVRQQEVLAAYGSTLLLVQTAEHVIKMCLTFVLPKNGKITVERLQSTNDKKSKKTLGQFLIELRKRADIEATFDKQLVEFLKLRNDFTHNLMTIDGLGFDTLEELDVALEFAVRLAELAEHIVRVFMGWTRAWQKQIGMPDNFAQFEFFQEIDRVFLPASSAIFLKKPGL